MPANIELFYDGYYDVKGDRVLYHDGSPSYDVISDEYDPESHYAKNTEKIKRFHDYETFILPN